MSRSAERERATKETSVEVSIDLDGTGRTECSTGIPFYDHMLDQLGRHGGFDLTVRAEGDLHIDTHHTVEDVAITLGEAFAEALGDKAGIRRFASGLYPLDEALVEVSLDLSGRPFVAWDVPMPESLPLGNPAFDPAARRARRVVVRHQRRHHAARQPAGRAQRAPHHRGHVQGSGPVPARRRARRVDRGARAPRACCDGAVAAAVTARVAVVDYGIGNLHSAHKALVTVGADARSPPTPPTIEAADAVVLPGVGAFGACMDALRAAGLEEVTPRRRRLGSAVPRHLRRHADALRRQRGEPRRRAASA